MCDCHLQIVLLLSILSLPRQGLTHARQGLFTTKLHSILNVFSFSVLTALARISRITLNRGGHLVFFQEFVHFIYIIQCVGMVVFIQFSYIPSSVLAFINLILLSFSRPV